MDILAPLFANSGLAGAVVASLLGIIYVLLRNQRIEATERNEAQRELIKALMELSGLIREYRGMDRNQKIS